MSRVARVVALLVLAGACTRERPGAATAGDSASGRASGSAVASTAPTDSLAPMALQPGMTSALPQSSSDAFGAYRLAGNEPFWSVKIAADGITYSAPDYPKGIHFAAAAPERADEKLRWVAITAPPDAHTLDVTIEEERCRDSMSDKTWTHVAHVIFDGTRLEGCGERLSKAP